MALCQWLAKYGQDARDTQLPDDLSCRVHGCPLVANLAERGVTKGQPNVLWVDGVNHIRVGQAHRRPTNVLL
jgi:hypothetical protein